MFRPRVIPSLLLKDNGLVKTVRFNAPTYIGDPINAVKIYNELEADEICFLDITASKEGRLVSLDLVREIGDEAFMPFAVGGGIKTVEDIRNILGSGAEKVVLNTAAAKNPDLVREAAQMFGNQSIMVSIDVKTGFFGGRSVYVCDGSENTRLDPVAHAIHMAELGAGEILLNSIDKDGTMRGYDLKLIEEVAAAVDVPVIALGGAGRLEDLHIAAAAGASAVAAGSLFVFQGPRRAVLINYPDKRTLKQIFSR